MLNIDKNTINMNIQDVKQVAAPNNECVTFHDIENAYQRISNYVHETPVLTCSSFNRIASEKCQQKLQLYFKCENFQKTGSFKVSCLQLSLIHI